MGCWHWCLKDISGAKPVSPAGRPIVATYPEREIHVVLDNSTHKPKRDMWLKRHKNVHFH
jgi:hypothetical protein